jgi:hypothetical protein
MAVTLNNKSRRARVDERTVTIAWIASVSPENARPFISVVPLPFRQNEYKSKRMLSNLSIYVFQTLSTDFAYLIVTTS